MKQKIEDIIRSYFNSHLYEHLTEAEKEAEITCMTVEIETEILTQPNQGMRYGDKVCVTIQSAERHLRVVNVKHKTGQVCMKGHADSYTVNLSDLKPRSNPSYRYVYTGSAL